jgi:MFS family permease
MDNDPTTTPPPSPLSSPSITDRSSPWRNGVFLKVWGAQASGLVGQQFSVLAMPLVAVLTLHAAASTVALMVACFNLPWVVIGLFVGVAVDRLPRRSVLIISDIARAILLTAIPFCALLGVLSMPQLFIIGLTVGTLDVFWLTAFRSYVPTVVRRDHLGRAYSLIGASDSITRTAAPSLAGAIIQIVGPPLGLAVTSLTYLASATLNATIRQPEPPRPTGSQHDPVLKSFRAGLSYTLRHRLVLAMACSEATYFLFWSLTQSVLIVFLARELHMSPALIGLIFTVGTLGGLLGAATARRIADRIGIGATLIAGTSLRSLGMVLTPVVALFATGPDIGTIAVLMATRAINSYGWSVWDVNRETTQQAAITDDMRGRVNGSVLFLSGAMLAAGSAAGAAIVTLLGIIGTLIIGGAGTLLAVVWILQPPVVHAADHQAPSHDPTS